MNTPSNNRTPAADLLTTADLAKRWGRSINHISSLRCSGTGPKFLRIGPRSYFYRVKDVEAFEEALTFSSYAEAVAKTGT
ncbi:hypothetical protein [Rhodoblastus sp.]|jgi:hypothetical protein|uniref:helix-turn-helix transcriptional regulator n=1 Tax=Rhodoblastus sp. TaxID=1962975 RepID=UPI0025FCF706|nr:hypothetical protein [Rhodoblastus sp.]